MLFRSSDGMMPGSTVPVTGDETMSAAAKLLVPGVVMTASGWPCRWIPAGADVTTSDGVAITDGGLIVSARGENVAALAGDEERMTGGGITSGPAAAIGASTVGVGVTGPDTGEPVVFGIACRCTVPPVAGVVAGSNEGVARGSTSVRLSAVIMVGGVAGRAGSTWG